MLILYFHNDGTGTKETGNYNYYVTINNNPIAKGRMEEQPRGDWRDLLIQFGEQLRKEKNEEILTIAKAMWAEQQEEFKEKWKKDLEKFTNELPDE